MKKSRLKTKVSKKIKPAAKAKKSLAVRARTLGKKTKVLAKKLVSTKKVASPAIEANEREIRRMSAQTYMNETQLAFFKARLFQQRAEVLARQAEVKDRLNQQESFADPADRATAEEEHWLDLRLRERESFLLRKIDEAIRRISDREYGYCKVTGEPIGIPRLLARPTAEVCVDVKGQSEHIEAQYRDR